MYKIERVYCCSAMYIENRVMCEGFEQEGGDAVGGQDGAKCMFMPYLEVEDY